MDVTSGDLRRTRGYLVADRGGHRVGLVECPMYGTSPNVPDALAVKSHRLSRHRLLVPAAAIADVDRGNGVVGLNVERTSIRSFL